VQLADGTIVERSPDQLIGLPASLKVPLSAVAPPPKPHEVGWMRWVLCWLFGHRLRIDKLYVFKSQVSIKSTCVTCGQELREIYDEARLVRFDHVR
jgi:hypothetical protein